jgi:Holliday junction DNA helicase RuvA
VIASVSGIVKALTLNSAVIEVGGVGLLVHLAPRVAAGLSVGTFTSLQTSLLVKEDSLTLFGFESSPARELFELLQTVSGIGPKVAQSAISVYEVPEIITAISSENFSLLERIPGLGKKGAARLVLELKDKVTPLVNLTSASASRAPSWREQLEGALLNLGFTQRDSNDTLDALATQLANEDQSATPEIGILLRRALKIRGTQ